MGFNTDRYQGTAHAKLTERSSPVWTTLQGWLGAVQLLLGLAPPGVAACCWHPRPDTRERVPAVGLGRRVGLDTRGLAPDRAPNRVHHRSIGPPPPSAPGTTRRCGPAAASSEYVSPRHLHCAVAGGPSVSTAKRAWRRSTMRSSPTLSVGWETVGQVR